MGSHAPKRSSVYWYAMSGIDGAKLTIPGSVFYDIFMGVELNPALDVLGDIKLFINGRTAMMAWPLMSVLKHAY